MVTIAHGLVYGGGQGLWAGAATFRVAAEDARLAMPEAAIGLVPDAGIATVLRATAALTRSTVLCCTLAAVLTRRDGLPAQPPRLESAAPLRLTRWQRRRPRRHGPRRARPYLLLTAYYYSHYLLLTTHYSLLTTYYSLTTSYSLLPSPSKASRAG